ncbi:MAG TPA: hypothetical protein DD379_00010 [Cyanobacteria bacterium UBA11162]|nr:hypothetical protein [Cyanobacteria bacterium UBA11162]
MNQLNTRLKQLAIEAQQYPLKSKQRQLALANLLSIMEQSGKLIYPYRGQFQGLYQEIYAEAKQRLFCYICYQIDRYNPQSEVLQWANFMLKHRFFIEAIRDSMPIANQGLKHRRLAKFTIEALYHQNYIELNCQSSPSLLQEVMQSLEEDPEGIFKGTYIGNHPDANFQFLAIKIISGYSWKEISSELGIKISTLNSFYHRCLVKFSPKFKEYLS